MTTQETKQDGECPDTPPDDDCADCDTTLIDTLKCEAAGVAKEAEANAKYQDAVTDAQKQFNEIRNKYRGKRTEVALDVHDMHHQTKRAIDRIKCLIKQHRVIECLDEAWDDVKDALKCCPKDGGCCVVDGDCDFPIPETPDCEDNWEADLKKLIAEYTDHADAAHQCFTTLSGEPDALAQRVLDRKAELDDLLAKLGSDAAGTDLKGLYASALVLKYRLSVIWNGFADTKAFIDCLCRALTCWTKGSKAAAVLVGKLAVKQCQDAAKAERCTNIRVHTVDEILAVYEKKCCHDPCPPATDDGEDSDDDCGCGCHDEKPGATVES